MRHRLPYPSAIRFVAALMVTWACTPPATASGLDLFGLGARGEAMAGSVLATAEGFEATYYNPAGLAFAKNLSFAIGFHSATFDLMADAEELPALDAPVVTLGFGVPIPFGGVLKDRFSLGLAFLLPQKSVLIADIKTPGEPTFLLLENRAQTVSVLASLGIRVTDWLSVGLGTLALAELFGDISVAPNEAGRLGTSVRDELVADWSLIAGVMAKPIPELSLGLTFRTRSSAEFGLPITADLGEGFSIPLPRLDVRGTAQYDPAELGFEAAVRPLAWLLASAGFSWQKWSDFDNPIAYLAVPEGFPPQPSPNFDDTISLRLGVETDFEITPMAGLTGRLGLAWEPSPVPEQTGFHNHLDSDRLIVGLGLGASYGPVRLDLVGQVHRLSERTSRKDPALLTQADDEPAPESITYDGFVWMGGLQLGLTL